MNIGKFKYDTGTIVFSLFYVSKPLVTVRIRIRYPCGSGRPFLMRICANQDPKHCKKLLAKRSLIWIRIKLSRIRVTGYEQLNMIRYLSYSIFTMKFLLRLRPQRRALVKRKRRKRRSTCQQKRKRRKKKLRMELQLDGRESEWARQTVSTGTGCLTVTVINI